MSNWINRILMYGASLAAIVPVMANPLDVTHNSQVTLNHNDSLIFSISLAGSSYPGEIEFVLGGMPLGGPVASIPGTSGVYMPGILFSGTIESLDGSISIPFADANATRLGLPGGDLVMVPGSRSGGSYSGPIDLISAVVTLSSQEAAELFASGGAVIDVHNLGGSITFGYPGAPITNDFSASLISPSGDVSMGARVIGAQCVHTPEPATIGLLLLGLALMIPRVLRRAAEPSPVVAEVRTTDR
jgi:hypothetical protein